MPEALSLQDFTVREADWQADGNTLRNIRRLVFIVEQQVPEDEELDERDIDCWHWLASDNEDVPIGTGRLLPDGQIGRMAVLPAHRGKGIGAAILDHAVEKARHLGFEAVFLNAQTHALGFYENAGFTATGEPFLEAGIEHLQMTRTLAPLADQVQRVAHQPGMASLSLKPFTIKEMNHSAVASQIRQIRQITLVQELGADPDVLSEDEDTTHLHFVAEEEDGQVVGSVRMTVTGEISHLGVLPHYRHRGIGLSLLEACIAKARRFALAACTFSASDKLAPLLERAGFQHSGGEGDASDYTVTISREDVHEPLTRPAPGASGYSAQGALRLGEDNRLLLLRSEEDFHSVIHEMCAQARMSIRIWSPVLEHKLYDSKALQEIVSALARRNKYTRIEILVYDSHRVVKNGHALLSIARKLPSSIAMKLVHPELRALNNEFVLVDNAGAIYRLDAEDYNGWANFSNITEAGRLQRQFGSAWEFGLLDPNLRQLRI